MKQVGVVVATIVFLVFTISASAETNREAANRSGAIIGNVVGIKQIQPGKSYDVSWTIYSYLDIQSNISLILPNSQRLTFNGTRTYREQAAFSIGDESSYEHRFTGRINVPADAPPGISRVGFFTLISGDNSTRSMYALFPAGVVDRPSGSQAKLFEVDIVANSSGSPTACIPNFDSNGVSQLCWPFDEGKSATLWHLSGNGVGDGDHLGDDYYADDWNLGSGNSDAGLNINSATAGTVVFSGVGSIGGYGNQVVVRVRSNSNFAVRYTHLQDIAVSTGQSVEVGQLIGTNGISGLPTDQCNATYGYVCAHLHLVVYKNILDKTDNDQTVLYWLERGGYPSRLSGGPTDYAAKFNVLGP